MIEVELGISLFNHFLVSLLEVFGQDYVSVFPDCLHTGLLADRLYVCTTDFLGTRHEVFKINFFTEVHFACESLEDKSLLSSVWHGELYFSIKSAGSQQSRIKGVSSICRHNTLDVHRLVETIHLLKQLNKNSLNFSVCAGIGIESLGGNGVNLVDENN